MHTTMIRTNNADLANRAKLLKQDAIARKARKQQEADGWALMGAFGLYRANRDELAEMERMVQTAQTNHNSAILALATYMDTLDIR